MTIQTGSVKSPTKKSLQRPTRSGTGWTFFLEIVLWKSTTGQFHFQLLSLTLRHPTTSLRRSLPPKVAVYLGFPNYVCRSFLQRRLRYRPSVSLLIKSVFWLRIIPNLERYLKFIYGTSAVYSSRYSWLWRWLVEVSSRQILFISLENFF